MNPEEMNETKAGEEQAPTVRHSLENFIARKRDELEAMRRLLKSIQETQEMNTGPASKEKPILNTIIRK